MNIVTAHSGPFELRAAAGTVRGSVPPMVALVGGMVMRGDWVPRVDLRGDEVPDPALFDSLPIEPTRSFTGHFIRLDALPPNVDEDE